MNKHFCFLPVFAIILCAPFGALKAKESDVKNVLDTTIKKTDITAQNKETEEKKIWFRFKDEPLIDIINYLASEKKINVVLPAGKEEITQKVTFQFTEKISLSRAWEHLLTFLRISGYTIAPENDFYFVTQTSPKTNKDANKQTYPLYANVEISDLPDTNQKIRYIHYFANLQVGSSSSSSSVFSGGSSSGSVTSILSALLSDDATIVTEPDVNGVVITDYSRNIISIIKILEELDQHGFTDDIDIIALNHTTASTIASLFQQLINPSASSSSSSSQYGSFGSDSPTTGPSSETQSQYFSKSTRIVAENRTNSLIIMGKKTALKKAKSFIKKHLDVPLDSGDSVLHIYNLQYLKATDFQKTLQDIVNSSNSSSSSDYGTYGTQSTGSSSTGTSSGEQYFKGVIIQAESSGQSSSYNDSSSSFNWGSGGSSASGSASAPAAPVQSSNRLVIAAVREDWVRIKKLIEELDRPQLQVAIEVLIVDLSLERDKTFGSQIRNKKGLNLKNTNFQNVTLGALELQGGSSPSQTTVADALMGNLLQLGDDTSNIANSASAGSLILSFKDSSTNGMWLVTQLLQNYKDVKILSQPFIVALNNQNSSFTTNETRLLAGDITIPPGGGAYQQNTEAAKAVLGVSMTPLISSAGKINLGINISIEEFGASNSKLSRKITTNANINDGEVLVLGGLTKTKVTNDHAATPLLSKIPVFGWLFKRKDKVTIKDNLLVFICPRIITTYPGKFFDPFTSGKMTAVSNVIAGGENFDSLKDPITHWFFGSRDSEIATKRIASFERKDMFNDDETYNFDKYKSGARTIRVNTMGAVDQRTILPRKNILPPPPPATKHAQALPSPTTKNSLAAPEKSKRRISDHVHVEKVPTRIKFAQKQTSPAVLTEEQEFKNLFSQLKNPVS